MVGVTTIALIERKPTISRDLFTRYWRDVHGVMAARIPGFETYTQYHVTPVAAGSEPFEGIAIVTYASDVERQGLVTSEVTKHIHRDEQNVFRRALLYNLDEAALQASGDAVRPTSASAFFVIPEGVDPANTIDRTLMSGAVFCDTYNLLSGDPAAWNQTDTAGRRFVSIVHTGWADANAAVRAARELATEGVASYRLDEAHVMIDRGYPTPVGLRGLDAVRTIMEAGADNQLSNEVVQAIYGRTLAG